MRDVRGHHEGTQVQRPNGVKYVVVSLPDGRRRSRRACPHVHKPADKHKWCPEARQTLRDLQALDPGRLERNRLTLGAFLSEWLVDVRPRLAPATWRKHEQHCRNHLVPVFGHRRLSDLSVSDVRRYIDGAVLDPQTVRHHRATLRRALADALRDGLVTRNVAALAEPPPLHEAPAAGVEGRRGADDEGDRMKLFCILLGHSWTEDDRDEQPVINTRWRCRRCDAWYIGSRPWR